MDEAANEATSHLGCDDTQQANEDTAFRVVELFCGAGGMSLGLGLAGMTISGACDSWHRAVAVYERNLKHGARIIDLSQPHAAIPWICSLRPDLIAGGPPCQDFSSAGKRIEGDRASLTIAMAMISVAVKPEWVLIENVRGAARTETWREAREILKRGGYGLTEQVLDASYYGVPQDRKRLILVGRLGERDGFLSEALSNAATAKRMTLRDAFGDTLGDHIYRHPRSSQRRGVFAVDEPSPTVRNARRRQPRTYVPHPGDSNYSLCEGMHFRGHSGARAVRKLDEPAPAICRVSGEPPRKSYIENPHPQDACPPGKAYIPTQRDISRIQGYPETWDWKPGRILRDIDQMIANSVPPPLAQAIGKVILARHRKETHPPIEGNYYQWLLRSGKAANGQMASNAKWRLKLARGILGGRTYEDPRKELAALEECSEFHSFDTRKRASLRAALRLHREWLDLPAAERKRKAKRKPKRKSRCRSNAKPTGTPRVTVASPPPIFDETCVLA